MTPIASAGIHGIDERSLPLREGLQAKGFSAVHRIPWFVFTIAGNVIETHEGQSQP
jgi:hypothetical protein